jgi:hypothetical protein
VAAEDKQERNETFHSLDMQSAENAASCNMPPLPRRHKASLLPRRARRARGEKRAEGWSRCIFGAKKKKKGVQGLNGCTSMRSPPRPFSHGGLCNTRRTTAAIESVTAAAAAAAVVIAPQAVSHRPGRWVVTRAGCCSRGKGKQDGTTDPSVD